MSQNAGFGTIVKADGNPVQLSGIPSGLDVVLVAHQDNASDVSLASSSADLATEATRFDMDPGESIGLEDFGSTRNIWLGGAAGTKLKWFVRKR